MTETKAAEPTVMGVSDNPTDAELVRWLAGQTWRQGGWLVNPWSAKASERLLSLSREVEAKDAAIAALKAAMRRMLGPQIGYRDHMSACDKIMGAAHPCTCGADEYRKLLLKLDEPR